MINTKFEFGQKVMVNGRLARIKYGENRRWVNTPHEPREAIFLLGVNLSDGKMEYNTISSIDSSSELYFEETKRYRGAWICEKNRIPRKVFLTSIIEKEKEKEKGKEEEK